MTRLSISRAWEETRAVLAADGKLIGTVALALFVLPGVILNMVMPGGRFPQPAAPMVLTPGMWIGWVVGLIAVLVTLVGQISLVRLAMAPHVSVGEAIAHGFRRIAAYIGAVLLWTVPFLLIGSFLYALVGRDPAHPSGAAAIALLLLTGVGLYLAIRLILMPAVASAEPLGPVGILQRSWRLTGGNWWRLFLFVALFAVAAIILIFAVAAVIGLVARIVFGDLTPLSIGGLLVSIISQLVSAFVSVILFVMLARIYVQLAGGAEAEVGVPTSGI